MLPFKNMLRVAMSAVKEYGKDDGGNLAAALAFGAFFSLFPLILFLVSLASFFVSTETAQQWVLHSVPVQAGQDQKNVFLTTITDVIAARGAGTGIAAIVGLGGLLLSASGVFGTLETAVNRAWGCEKAGSLIKDKVLAFIMVLGFGLVLLVSTIISSVLNGIQQGVSGVIGDFAWLWQIVNILVAIALMGGVISALFHTVCRCHVSWKDVWPGGLLTAILLQVLQQGFGFYLGHFGNYQAVYGALGGIIALETLLYLACQVLIFGAEFCSEYEVERKKVTAASATAASAAAKERQQAAAADRATARRAQRPASAPPAPPPGPVGQAPPQAAAGVLGAAAAVAATVGLLGRLLLGGRNTRG